MINGTSVEPPIPTSQPHEVIAERVYTADMEELDTPWAELEPGEREAYALHIFGILQAYVALLSEQGFQVIPPRSVVRPKNRAEAEAMMEVSKDFFDGIRTNKDKLLGSVAQKLIVPKGAH